MARTALDIVGELERDVREKQALVKAAETKLSALQQAHKELQLQVEATHTELAKGRDKVDAIDAVIQVMLNAVGGGRDLDSRVAEADRIVADFLKKWPKNK